MKVYIDEGGHFVPAADISVLCALSLPHQLADSAAEEILRVSQRWPRKDGELKGGILGKSQLTLLTTILFRHEALLHCIANDTRAEDEQQVAAHKAHQCNGLTMHLTDEHSPEVIARVRELRGVLERMPIQLYIQFVLLSDLVLSTAESASIYFSQRRPTELARYEWTIDAKDPTRISVQEQWWRDTIGPMGESKTRTRPFLMVRDSNFDYSHFLREFSIEKELWWPDRPREVACGVDIKKLIEGNVRFADSRKEVLLQAVDVIANFMRRTMNGEITDTDIMRQLGRLQIVRNREGKKQAMEFASFSGLSSSRPGLGRIAGVMTSTARQMLSSTGFASSETKRAHCE